MIDEIHSIRSTRISAIYDPRILEGFARPSEFSSISEFTLVRLRESTRHNNVLSTLIGKFIADNYIGANILKLHKRNVIKSRFQICITRIYDLIICLISMFQISSMNIFRNISALNIYLNIYVLNIHPNIYVTNIYLKIYVCNTYYIEAISLNSNSPIELYICT